MAAFMDRPKDDAFRARPARWLSALAVGAAGVVLVAAAEPPAPPAEASPPAHAAPDADLVHKRALSARESWWAWKPLVAPSPPSVREAAWVRTPIDRFVLARLEADGIEHAPEATREAL
ncbi:MAG: hypothetical protein ACKOEL_03705, partial [Planctomycetota bacterium]